MFVPPINLGGWKPSPATMSEWIYQIWKYLQENPIATQEQIKQFIDEEIGDDIAEKLPEVLPEELAKYFEENPIDFPVDSVNGKLGTVLLELADIVQSDSMLPVVSLANDEADQVTLVNAFIDGARICVIDEESVSVMLPTYGLDGGVTAITLLPMSTGSGSGDFSPITLSIGSSGNKTLNAGGTVAFTLSEIGAAPASVSATVSGIQDDITGIQGDISDIQGDITDIQGDITALEDSTRTVYHVGDTITLDKSLVFTGNFRGNARFGFTWCLPIKIGSDVTGFYMTNASTCGIYKSGSSSAIVSGPITGTGGSMNSGLTSGIASKELGILNVVIDFPTVSNVTFMMGYLALPSTYPTVITFT